MAHGQAAQEDSAVGRLTHYLGRVEDLVLTLTAIVLVVMALVTLINTLVSLSSVVTQGMSRLLAVETLDSVLLVIITMEVFYTVTLSLKSHTLVAEPFLIVGAIAAVRRVLVITAATGTPQANPEFVMRELVELGLLALVVFFIAASVYLLRKGQQYPSEKE
ncbi:MAG: phosphate-starvation-inducible PsiE family protein [Chloroflexi bacterium]|nr:phosphate-starvation-inducible PsiE family protein [Chloroflexota bacterium]